MRFGKKLALQVIDDQSGAPYLSHKPMKEAINRTVRELRMYQARLQNSDQDDNASCSTADNMPATPAELAEMEGRITANDRQLFTIVDEDLVRIHDHVRAQEARLMARLASLQDRLIAAGLLMDEEQLQRLGGALPGLAEDRSTLCKRVLELRIQGDPLAAFRAQQSLAVQHNAIVDLASLHAQYLEINVAGFRKLLKRHEKQIPHQFRSRSSPCLGFHKLVTRRSRTLLELVDRTKDILREARGVFEQASRSADVAPEEFREMDADWVELEELKGFGPECEMVLSVQRQLKEPCNSQLLQNVASFYPKPGASLDEVAAEQQRQKQQLQQQQQQQHLHQHQQFQGKQLQELMSSWGMDVSSEQQEQVQQPAQSLMPQLGVIGQPELKQAQVASCNLANMYPFVSSAVQRQDHDAASMLLGLLRGDNLEWERC